MTKNSILASIISSKYLLILLGLFLVAWLVTFHHRYIEADECILGEYSYSFLQHGYVKVKTIPLISDWDERMFAHHKLFTWFGALIISIFGWSITWFKISVLPWYLLFYYFLYQYFKFKKLSQLHFIWAALLIFTTPIILLKSYSFRPDIILMTEGMALLYFLSRTLDSKQIKWAIASGVVAGLGFLTHLNGAAFCIAGFVFLLLYKEYRLLLPYVLAGGTVGGLYFIELLPPGNFDAFVTQLKNWPTVNHGENFVGNGSVGSLILGRVEKLLSEQQRFFWGDKVMGFSVLFFLTLIFSFNHLRKNYSELLIFLLLLVLSLNIFGSHVAERYILFYYGAMSVIAAIGLGHLVNAKRWQQYLILVSLAFHFVLAGNMIFKILERKYDAPKLNHFALSQINDKSSKILVPYEMIYNDFPDLDLYVFKTYEYLGEELPSGKMSQLQVFNQAHELGMDFIIINERLAGNKSAWFYQWEIQPNSYYKEFFRDDRFLILQRNASSNGN